MLKMDISEIRLKNAQHLAESNGGISAFAEKLGKSQPQVSCLIGKKPTRKIGNKIAREIEKTFNQEKDWLDHTHSEIWEKSKTTEPKLLEVKESYTAGLKAKTLEIAQKIEELTPEQQAFINQTIDMLKSTNKRQNQEAA